MKPALFIDFDGTLSCDRLWQSLGVDDYDRINDFIFGNGGVLANDWMAGKYSSEQICREVAHGLGIAYSLLWDVLLEDCRNTRIDKQNLSKIDSLRRTFTLAMVTANMDCFDRFTMPALGLEKHFDYIINSCNEGVFKHDANGNKSGLLEAAIRKTGAEVGRSILIDDSTRACANFEKLGGRALRGDKTKPLSHWLDYLLNNKNNKICL